MANQTKNKGDYLAQLSSCYDELVDELIRARLRSAKDGDKMKEAFVELLTQGPGEREREQGQEKENDNEQRQSYGNSPER